MNLSLGSRQGVREQISGSFNIASFGRDCSMTMRHFIHLQYEDSSTLSRVHIGHSYQARCSQAVCNDIVEYGNFSVEEDLSVYLGARSVALDGDGAHDFTFEELPWFIGTLFRFTQSSYHLKWLLNHLDRTRQITLLK